MFNRNHVCAIAAVAAFSMLSLTACSDENSDITNVPEESELSSSSTPSVEAESSSSELVLSSSSAPSSSSEESSSSSEKLSDLQSCDTTGASVGSICKTRDGDFVYAGDGEWRDYDRTVTKIKVECSAENDGTMQFVNPSENSDDEILSRLFICKDGAWLPEIKQAYELDKIKFKCSAVKPHPVDGDECSYKDDDGYLRNFMYVHDAWWESKVDSTFGMCPTNAINSRLYKKSGADYYYCAWGKWFLAVMVPQQFTDPRKEGLSDEEYDVLDLPKNASVGDRAEGALERCVNGVTLMLRNGIYGYGTAKTSAYCVAENHYRYRSNGTWTLETDEDLQNDSRFQEIECTEGNLGAEYELGDGKIYRCENVRTTDFCNKNTCKYSWKPGAVEVDAHYKRSILIGPTEACNESNDGEEVTIDAGPIVGGYFPCHKRLLDYQCKYDSENSSGKWEVVGENSVSFYD